jgi:hypothetical protein
MSSGRGYGRPPEAFQQNQPHLETQKSHRPRPISVGDLADLCEEQLFLKEKAASAVSFDQVVRKWNRDGGFLGISCGVAVLFLLLYF